MNRTRRVHARLALATLYLAAASGCYRYAYHERSAGGTHDLAPVDRQQVETHSTWSYWWGLQQSEWMPDPQGCDGLGAGRVEVGFRWFSVPLMLLTLGIATPSEITLYCNVDTAPDEGQPVGVGGRSRP